MNTNTLFIVLISLLFDTWALAQSFINNGTFEYGGPGLGFWIDGQGYNQLTEPFSGRTSEENLLLSQQRDNAVFTYLVTKQNIEAQRIIPVGKGEDFPRFIYNPETKTRVQLIENYILDSFHENKEKQEILHQFNRRTEAKIIDDNFEYDPTFKVDESFFI